MRRLERGWAQAVDVVRAVLRAVKNRSNAGSTVPCGLARRYNRRMDERNEQLGGLADRGSLGRLIPWPDDPALYPDIDPGEALELFFFSSISSHFLPRLHPIPTIIFLGINVNS